MSHSPEDEALRSWQDAGQATRAVPPMPSGHAGAVPLTAEQRRALEVYATELTNMRPTPGRAVVFEVLDTVLRILGYDMVWQAGAWHLEENSCTR